MTQWTRGPYALLQLPKIYSAFQSLLGAHQARQQIVDSYICPTPGCSVLDLGCGAAAMLPYLKNTIYTGIDLNPLSIASASRAEGARATFLVGDVRAAEKLPPASFDRVMALGLLHHLADDEVRQLARIVRDRRAPGGHFVAVDPTLTVGQHWIARQLALADSGRNVRPPQAYAELVVDSLPGVRTMVRHDLSRIPYSHAITVAASARV
jgi:SAM-dependent methyltransferase